MNFVLKKITNWKGSPQKVVYPEQQILWCDIEGFEGIFQISTTGKCRRIDKKPFRMVADKIQSTGYVQHLITHKGKTASPLAHRSVMLSFDPPDIDPNTLFVNHIDSNTLNNNFENLEWVLPCGNTYHAITSGSAKSEITNPDTIRDIQAIKGVDHKTIARSLRLKTGTIKSILTGKAYAIARTRKAEYQRNGQGGLSHLLRMLKRQRIKRRIARMKIYIKAQLNLF